MLIFDECIENCWFHRLKTSEIRHICLYLKTLIFIRYFTKNLSPSRVFDIFHRRFLQWLRKSYCQVGMIRFFHKIIISPSGCENPQIETVNLLLLNFRIFKSKFSKCQIIPTWQSGFPGHCKKRR